VGDSLVQGILVGFEIVAAGWRCLPAFRSLVVCKVHGSRSRRSRTNQGILYLYLKLPNHGVMTANTNMYGNLVSC